MNAKEITRDLIALIVVGAAVASLFLTVNEIGEQTIRTLAGVVIGYYFGSKALPLGIGNVKKKKK